MCFLLRMNCGGIDMTKKIAVIGSSGGNLFTQGGSDPVAMMKEITMQMNSIDIDVAQLNYVCASASMDGISKDAKASLFKLEDGEVKDIASGALYEINDQAREADKALAAAIRAGEIDGVVLLSADPNDVNKESLVAAAEMKIPAVGTGGSSMAATQALGVNVVSASGTTGTTNRTRAVAFASALAKEWGMKYRPIIGTSKGAVQQGNVWKRINFKGIMMTSMPGFIAMAIILAISKIPGLEALAPVFDTLIGVLPVILAAIAAKQVSGLDEVGIVAGVIAGVLAKDGGIIGGLIAGILAGVLAYYIITLCFKWKFPATTANIAAGGLAGLVAGLVGMFLIAPVALWLGNLIKAAIEMALAFSPVLAGAIAGLLIWPAIIGGVYHAAILPIVLLEMEAAGFSFLGAIDMTGLVMVSAGITLANVVFPRQKGDAAVALPGFLINMGFGTFVEAAYPFMFSDKLVFAGALIASTVSGAMVGMFDVKGTAYVPSVLAPGLANDGKALAFALCMLAALAVAFVITVIANKAARVREKKAAE